MRYLRAQKFNLHGPILLLIGDAFIFTNLDDDGGGFMFERGDVVVLKSGGPRMTINEAADRTIHCVWFVGSEQKYAAFDIATVQKSEDIRAHARPQVTLASFQRRAS